MFNLAQFRVSDEWSDANKRIEVVKWMRIEYVQRSMRYSGFYISPFGTWGRATYVVPTKNFFSSAHYGKVACVGTIRLGTVFDASIPENDEFFRNWVISRYSTYRDAQGRLKALNVIRYDCLRPTEFYENKFSVVAEIFKDQFAPPLDTIVFSPDQFSEYTKWNDVWFALLPKISNSIYYTDVVGFRVEVIMPKGYQMRHTITGRRWYDRDATSFSIRLGTPNVISVKE